MKGKLRVVTFVPGVSVSMGGRHSDSTCWARERHPDITAEECEDGSVVFRTGTDTLIRRIWPRGIAWKIYEAETSSR